MKLFLWERLNFKGSGRRWIGSVFHMLCPGHGDSKQVSAATAYKGYAIFNLTRLPVCLYVYMSFCLSFYDFFCNPIVLSKIWSVSLPVCLGFCLSTCLSLYLSLCRPVYLSICLSVFHFVICLSIYLPIYLSTYTV